MLSVSMGGQETLRERLRLNQPWPLIDIVKKLVKAADILLHHYDYDGDCWEQIQEAWIQGKKALKGGEV